MKTIPPVEVGQMHDEHPKSQFMREHLVSVIVTCFNQESWLSHTLSSVLTQTYGDWECIVVDDGSTDSSGDIARQLAAQDNRIKYLKQDNQGVAAARNCGFEMAHGEFIQFLDGDDTLLPEKLARQTAILYKNPKVDICICDHQHFHESSGQYKHYQFEKLAQAPLQQLLFGWQDGVAFPNHSPLYRRSIWDAAEVPFPIDYRHRSEDWVFNVIVALKNPTYYFLDEILCNYHMTGLSYTSETLNSAASAIYAAFYMNELLPGELRNEFLDHTIRKSMNRYVESRRVEILRSSANWRFGNTISKPLFLLLKFLKKA